ncbi:hypothetical protein [Rathayibacter sp. VKM Ac-2630]|uniref:hypothetical protein n=1 Tax=Rathayibacter sp. VKM Ac-2630 TaxID=1938617 RepID=UPI001F344AED|nr:hypothetical protein [Rathayibacter sp. VKM Ac-2630]
MPSTDGRESAAPRILVVGEALIDIVERDGASSEHVAGRPPTSRSPSRDSVATRPSSPTSPTTSADAASASTSARRA